MNPGRFFDAAVLPLLPFFEMISEDRDMAYPGRFPLVRTPYWRQISRFVAALIMKFKSSISLLPHGARQFVETILTLEPQFPHLKYILLVENFICRYLTKYVSSTEKIILVDVTKVFRCLCPMPNALRKDIQTVITEERLEIDSLLQLMRLSSEPFDELLDAFEIAGKFTLVTTRDLALIFKGVQAFQEVVPIARKTILAAPLAGLAAPKVVNDSQFLPLRVLISEYQSDDFDLKPTQPYDEVTDLLNLVNFCEFEYDTPSDLSSQMRKMCSVFISPVLEQRLTPELLVEPSQVQSNVIENPIFLKRFSKSCAPLCFPPGTEPTE
jgi:hypothetical protein